MEYQNQCKLHVRILPSKWVHLCYIDRELYDEFLNTVAYPNKRSMISYLRDWFKAEFNLEITDLNSIITLKQTIILHQISRMPINLEVKANPSFDRYGLVRLWVSDRMRMEIEKWKN